jgi:nitrate/nitrite transporter NarK
VFITSATAATLLAAAFGYSGSTMHAYALGAFIEPLQREFSWSRAQIAGGITIAGLVAAIFSVPIGLTVDRVRPRRIALVGILLMCGAIAMLGTATGSTANWILLWCLIAVPVLPRRTRPRTKHAVAATPKLLEGVTPKQGFRMPAF